MVELLFAGHTRPSAGIGGVGIQKLYTFMTFCFARVTRCEDRRGPCAKVIRGPSWSLEVVPWLALLLSLSGDFGLDPRTCPPKLSLVQDQAAALERPRPRSVGAQDVGEGAREHGNMLASLS